MKCAMGDGANIDPRMQGALARLTDNEKECLRRRLQQQTAKEMALDLGVSPHAVEKRLKMARTKLGLSSSLEAARLLTSSEQYQQTGPHAPDLDASGNTRNKWLTRPLTLGALIMTLVAAAAITPAIPVGKSAFGARASRVVTRPSVGCREAAVGLLDAVSSGSLRRACRGPQKVA